MTKIACYHMPEAYYAAWQRLHKRERALFTRATKLGGAALWLTWQRAAARLAEHENSHCTD